MQRRKLAIAIVATLCLVAPRARAQANARAEALFQEARALVEKGRYEEACPKLEESQRLEPAVGTQFNLADCYEHTGKTATAYALFRDVAGIARAAGKFEREKSARERMAQLEPRLARFRLVVKSEAPGLEVRVDGEPVDRSRWAEAIPVDPGRRRIAASAPQHTPYETSVDAVESTTTDVEIPALVDNRPAQRVVVEAPAPKPSRTLPLVVGGVGVVGLGVGAVFGALSLSSRSDAQRECPEEQFAFRCPTEAGASAWNDATAQGNVSTVGFIVGGVALATAVVLYLVTPSPKARAQARGVLLEGAFW